MLCFQDRAHAMTMQLKLTNLYLERNYLSKEKLQSDPDNDEPIIDGLTLTKEIKIILFDMLLCQIYQLIVRYALNSHEAEQIIDHYKMMFQYLGYDIIYDEKAITFTLVFKPLRGVIVLHGRTINATDILRICLASFKINNTGIHWSY
jgi:hypothetical protein